MVDLRPLSFEILKRAIKENTVSVIEEKVESSLKNFYAQVANPQRGGISCPIPTLLIVISTFNAYMDDALAQNSALLWLKKKQSQIFKQNKSHNLLLLVLLLLSHKELLMVLQIIGVNL
jgi:hypothetical protein